MAKYKWRTGSNNWSQPATKANEIPLFRQYMGSAFMCSVCVEKLLLQANEGRWKARNAIHYILGSVDRTARYLHLKKNQLGSQLIQPNQHNSHLKRTISTNCCIHTVYLLMTGYRYAQNIFDEIYCRKNVHQVVCSLNQLRKYLLTLWEIWNEKWQNDCNGEAEYYAWKQQLWLLRRYRRSLHQQNRTSIKGTS